MRENVLLMMYPVTPSGLPVMSVQQPSYSGRTSTLCPHGDRTLTAIGRTRGKRLMLREPLARRPVTR